MGSDGGQGSVGWQAPPRPEWVQAVNRGDVLPITDVASRPLDPALLIDEADTGAAAGIVTRVDLRQFTLPVLLANDQEAAAHEEVLKQLDKASGGKTLWRLAGQPQSPAA